MIHRQREMTGEARHHRFPSLGTVACRTSHHRIRRGGIRGWRRDGTRQPGDRLHVAWRFGVGLSRQPGSVRLEVGFRCGHWPVNIAIDFVGWSKEEDALVPGTGRVIRQSADIFELDLGVRKVWDQGPFFQPFVGGGISLVTAERQSSGIEYDGASAGLWVDAGIYLGVTTHFNIGAELRYTWAEVDLGPERLNTGGITAGALVGFRWYSPPAAPGNRGRRKTSQIHWCRLA